ncbi:RAS associated with diabetes protein 51C [Wolffia australiana]
MELQNLLPVSASHRGKLVAAGYTSLASLSSISVEKLAQELSIPIQEAKGILKAVSQLSRLERWDEGPSAESSTLGNIAARTAWDMLSDEQGRRYITTFSGELDEILGGGIHCNEVTEIGGVPGIGKTQLGIQLAVNVQIPVRYGGLGGKAIYIDTEGSFMVERASQIAEACITDLHIVEDNMQANNFLSNIFYFRICSCTEQIAVINHLEKFMEEHEDVKLIVIDSITFHFRQDFDDFAHRTRLLSGISLKLMKLAKRFGLAVVLLNQVTTKFIDGSFQLTLALGESWSHACTNRLVLYWQGNERWARVDKSPSLPPLSSSFSVASQGIRDAIPRPKRPRLAQ